MPSKRQREEWFVVLLGLFPQEYEVKWAGFDDAENTWEPVSSLSDCQRLLNSFWKEVGKESFHINVPGFVVPASEAWIIKEKNHFATETSPDEVREQNRNPKRRRTIPSSPLPSPRKVSWAKTADVHIIPYLAEVENTAQTYHSSQQPLGPSDSDDGFLIQQHPPTLSDSNEDTLIVASAIPENTPQTSEPSVPEPTADDLFTPPPSPYYGIKIFDDSITPSSTLATKQRLAKAPVAPNIPRDLPKPAASQTAEAAPADDDSITPSSTLTTEQRLAKAPVAPNIPRDLPKPAALQTAEAAPADDGMDVDPTPTFAPDTVPDADTDRVDPIFGPPFVDEDIGLYAPGEDQYAGLRGTEDLFVDYAPEGGQGDYHPGNFDVDGADSFPDEVDDFLNSMRLPTPVDRGPDYRPSRPIYEPAPMPKWTWYGQLAVSVRGKPATSETLCEKAAITDSTECAPPRIASFVPSKEPLQLPASYDINDILLFLRACNPPHQYARLVAEGRDAERVKIFGDYLARKTQACMMPALWDGRLNGVLLFVSPTSRPLLEYLRTPPDLYQETSLVVILLFARDPPPIEEHIKKMTVPLKRKVEPAIAITTQEQWCKSTLITREQWCKSLQTERDYHVSLRILQLPKAIREYALNHTLTVWFKRNINDEPDPDTQHLMRVLGVDVVPPPLKSIDIVFIHVRALQNIHNLPHLAHLRLRPEVRFCLYGTHETVPLNLWGFREIYLLGGVVTFTPEALVNDAWSVLKTIRQIHAHPLWTCYLTPHVVGMALKLAQLREDEMPEYTETLPFGLNSVVEAIQKGEISLMTAPLDGSTNEFKRWVLGNSLLKPRTTEALLECCTKAFDDIYATSPQENWSTISKNDLMADVRRMQIQPGAFADYRRFVVLDSSIELRYNLSDGIEWNTVSRFDFHDSFVEALEKLSIA
ncbi:hypothetical protein K438DRAFT_1938709 [Mycena galopus ATCC 62051]|nr:hypothetical protein K438DRAFT_1938709 [Mycena galopus ATCC 62051]